MSRREAWVRLLFLLLPLALAVVAAVLLPEIRIYVAAALIVLAVLVLREARARFAKPSS